MQPRTIQIVQEEIKRFTSGNITTKKMWLNIEQRLRLINRPRCKVKV